MIGAGDAAHRVHELLPQRALLAQRPPPLGREAVVPSATLTVFLDPPPGDQSAGFEPAEEGIERGDAITELPARALFDEAADLVAMPRAGFEQRQDEQLGVALLQFAAEHSAT